MRDRNGRKIQVGDTWEFHGVRYKVERDENGELYFRNQHKNATPDDHIPGRYSEEGIVVDVMKGDGNNA